MNTEKKLSHIEFLNKRIEAAENMLKYSDYSCLDISEYLCFSSESHFIQVLKKHTGYTPKAYRRNFSAHENRKG